MFKLQLPRGVRGSRIEKTAGGLALAMATSLLITTAASARDKRLPFVPETAAPPASPGAPAIMTLISINKQRMYVYDANGFLTTSRVSTGTLGYDTPKGIYSIIQKKVDHESNLYDGAPMPHMQRLLWSGIAMHGGQVPRYPASHGCVRLPYSFAEKFFGMTALSHRVIITPDVQAPVRFSHPLLFTPLPEDDSGFVSSAPARTRGAIVAARAEHKRRVVTADLAAKAALAMAREAEALSAAEVIRARDQLKAAKLAHKAPAAAAAKAARQVSLAEGRLRVLARHMASKSARMRADQLLTAQRDEALERQRAEGITAAAATAADTLQSARDLVKTNERLLAEAVARARSDKDAVAKSITVEAAAFKAREDFELAERNRPRPVSVMVSSQTGRIYVRQGFEPIAEADVEIQNPDRPLGTYLFTATSWRDGDRSALDWTAVGVNEKGDRDSPRGRNEDANRSPISTDASRAQAALDRISIPANIREVISEVIKPGSSLIISDYDMARSEVGKGTDFIVQMPEVIAKFRSPAEIAKARGKTNRNFARAAVPWDYAEDGMGRSPFGSSVGYYVTPQQVWKVTQKRPAARPTRRYQSSIPSFFGYAYD